MVTGSRRRLAAAAIVGIIALSAGCQASSADDRAPADNATIAPAVAAARKCAATTLRTLDRSERVGQLLVVGDDADRAQRATAWVEKYHLGGVLLTGRSTESVKDVKKLTDDLHDAAGDGVPPIIAVAQDSGADQTLQGADFFDVPDAVAQARLDDRELTTSTRSWAEALHLGGVDLALGPVADTVLTDTRKDNPVVGATGRSFGSDPAQVGTRVDLVVKAAGSQKVLSALQYFPGVGRLTEDPATSKAPTDAQLTINDPQIAPFVMGIEAGADIVVISTATYPQLGDDTPAVYSRAVVSGLLRDVVGFTGVAMSDDLSRTRAAKSEPAKQRGVQFIRAGGDLVVSNDPRTSLDLLDGMLAADEKDQIFRKQVDASVLRVLALKAQQDLLPCS